MNKLRIGLVGAGFNTRQKHIPGLQALEHVELAGIANRTLASAQKVAEQFGIPKTFEYWWELVRSDEIDAVVVGTWPNMHARVTVAALESGKHVMCEARMARNFDEAKTMLRAAQKHPQLVAQIVPSPSEVDPRIGLSATFDEAAVLDDNGAWSGIVFGMTR